MPTIHSKDGGPLDRFDGKTCKTVRAVTEQDVEHFDKKLAKTVVTLDDGGTEVMVPNINLIF